MHNLLCGIIGYTGSKAKKCGKKILKTSEEKLKPTQAMQKEKNLQPTHFYSRSTNLLLNDQIQQKAVNDDKEVKLIERKSQTKSHV